jgi:hypothetical protein
MRTGVEVADTRHLSNRKDQAMLTVTEQKLQLGSMKTHELVAYWNIIQAGRRMLSDDATRAKLGRHLPIVDRLLSDRGVAHEVGKRTKRAT